MPPKPLPTYLPPFTEAIMTLFVCRSSVPPTPVIPEADTLGTQERGDSFRSENGLRIRLGHFYSVRGQAYSYVAVIVFLWCVVEQWSVSSTG